MWRWPVPAKESTKAVFEMLVVISFNHSHTMLLPRTVIHPETIIICQYVKGDVVFFANFNEANRFNYPLTPHITIGHDLNLPLHCIISPPEPGGIFVMARQIANTDQLVSIELIIIAQVISA